MREIDTAGMERDYRELVHGEYPPNLQNIPGTRQIDESPRESRLRNVVEGYLEDNPGLIKFAKDAKKDVIARVNDRGKGLIIGVGVAALATATAIVVYRHKHKKDKDSDEVE